MKAQYKRALFAKLLNRMREPRRFLQVLAGPRQVGKTTLAQQVARELEMPVHYASADDPTLQDRGWLNQQWDIARILTRKEKRTRPAILMVESSRCSTLHS